jgi:hypothetical protein
MASLPMPPFKELSQCIKYDPSSGIGTWLIDPGNGIKIGATAGVVTMGYLRIRYKGKRYPAHRIFWFLHTGHDPGELSIDHIDENKLNNKFSNLRLATHSQNIFNIKKTKRNTSGHRGVSWSKQNQKYLAYITFSKQYFHLGLHKTFEQAVKARQAKELELYGEFSPLHQLDNDHRLILDNDDQQLSLLWHPSFRRCSTHC